MTNHLLDEIYFKLKLIGIYQIIEGVVGLVMTGYQLVFFWPILDRLPITSVFAFIAAISCAAAIFFSIRLIKREQRSIDVSIAFQFLQIFSFSYLTYSFSFGSGLCLKIVLQFSETPHVNLGLTWAFINLYTNVKYPSIININLIPVFLLLYMIRAKRRIKSETVVSEFLIK